MLLRTIHSHSIQRQDGRAYLVRPLASLDPDRSWRNILDKNLAVRQQALIYRVRPVCLPRNRLDLTAYSKIALPGKAGGRTGQHAESTAYKNLAAWRNVLETRHRYDYQARVEEKCAQVSTKGRSRYRVVLQGFKSLAAANQNNDGSASGRCSDNVAPPSQSLTFISQYPDQPGRNPKRSSAPRLPMTLNNSTINPLIAENFHTHSRAAVSVSVYPSRVSIRAAATTLSRRVNL